MNTPLSRLISSVVLAGAALATSSYATAGDIDPSLSVDPAVKVRFADLNPNTEEGARVLYGRISAAAQTVCGLSFSLWDSNRYLDWKACYQATIDRQVIRINWPTLTAYRQTLRHPPVSQAALPSGNAAQGQVAANTSKATDKSR